MVSAPTETNQSAPSIWRTLGRLLHESVYILFFVGVHKLIRWWLITTEQDQEWWARYLLQLSIAFAVIAFTVIFGSELVVDCKVALLFAYRGWKKSSHE